ncbi:P-loop NTPase [candidate division KSB1 bacterium]
MQFEHLDSDTVMEIREACAYLFSVDDANNPQFIKNLHFDTVKKAYRLKVKKYHPDLHQNDPEDILEKRRERFKVIQKSYKLLEPFLISEEEQIPKEKKSPKKIIAVGGAKGGIGKSIFTTNLSVYLHSLGKKTIVADLDLGGANMHLYLGESLLDKKINDFVNRNVSSINDIAVETKYGPLLIGGDSSQLGAANFGFGTKLKLQRAIKNLEADHVILDLGGDTSYNIIDFFLLADSKIVVTTLEPASYLDAYRFIKVALYRKLNRLFSRESEFYRSKNEELEQLLKNATGSTNGRVVKNIDILLSRIKDQMPQNLPFIKDILTDFEIFLVLNKTEHNSEADKVIRHIQNISRKMLSIDVRYLGCIPEQREIAESVKNFIPVVAGYPEGNLARDIGGITERLFSG